MVSTFWTHTIWYTLLGIFTLFELVFVMIKAERRKLTFAFYLTILGISLNFETMILIFFKAYAYYPMIIQNHSNPFDDVLAGNLFSQFSVAATILLVVVLNLKYYWYIILAFIYGIIEEWFLALGIYSHNWYRTWMTVVILPFAFWLSKKIYTKILQGIKPVLYYVYIFLGLFSLYVVTILWGLQVSGYLAFSTTVLHDPINSRYFIALALFFIPPSLAMMLIYFSRLKLRWKALIISVLYALYYIGYMLNLVWIKEGWFLLVTTVTIFWMYLSIFILDRLYGGLNNNSKYL